MKLSLDLKKKEKGMISCKFQGMIKRLKSVYRTIKSLCAS